MTSERYADLSTSYHGEFKLTESEIENGWHWCNEFDGLLVGPDMSELNCCSCLPPEHKVYLTKPPESIEPIIL